MAKPSAVLGIEERVEMNAASQELMSSIQGLIGSNSEKTVRRLSRKTGRWPADEIIHSGSIELDLAVGIGGLPRGKVIEIFGAESCGKSTVAQLIMANAQKQGLLGVYIDSEYALDPNYAETLGVDIDNMIVVNPDHLEQALDLIINLCDNGFDGFIAFDSIPNTIPKTMMENSAEDEGRRAASAAVYTRVMPVVKKKISDSGATLFMINQTRATMNTMPWEKKEDTPGGKMLKYSYDLRLEVKRKVDSGERRSGDGITEAEITVTCIKNKFGAPFKQGSFVIRPSVGIDPFEDAVNAALSRTIIFEGWKIDGDELIKKGNWFFLPFKKEEMEEFMTFYPDSDIIKHVDVPDEDGVAETWYFIQEYHRNKFMTVIEEFSEGLTEILREKVLNTLNPVAEDLAEDTEVEADEENDEEDDE